MRSLAGCAAQSGGFLYGGEFSAQMLLEQAETFLEVWQELM